MKRLVALFLSLLVLLAVPAAAKTGSNYSYWVASNVNLGSYGWTLVYMDE